MLPSESKPVVELKEKSHAMLYKGLRMKNKKKIKELKVTGKDNKGSAEDLGEINEAASS